MRHASNFKLKQLDPRRHTQIRIFKERVSRRLPRYVRPRMHRPMRCMRGVTLNRPGGASRDRTGDPLLAKQVLSQLSYGPYGQVTEDWWVWVDSNYRPHPYQGCALTN